jgi:hypothetical protein
MNAELEVPEEEPVSIPEVMTEQQVEELSKNPDALLKQLEASKTRFAALRPVDDLTAKQCAALIETCAFAARYAEGRRTAITDPLNKQVKDANLIWMPIVKGFQDVAKTRGAEVSQFIDDRRRAAEREQQRLIDAANAKQAELDAKAQELKDEEDRLRLAAEQAESPEEKARLEKQADKIEAKAEQAVLKSSQVVTPVVTMQEKSIDLGSSTFSAKAPKNTWMLAGYDKAKPLRLTDPKLAPLIGDISKLPHTVQFLITHADLNPVLLNKSFGVIEFPAPFAKVPDYGGSSVRGK